MSEHVDVIRRHLDRWVVVGHADVMRSLDTLEAENQRFRGALERIADQSYRVAHTLGSQPHQIAYRALHGTPSAAQTLEDSTQTKGTGT